MPVFIWMALVFYGSGDTLSARKTSRFIRPLLHWLLPGASEKTINTLHGVIRKGGHVSEYAVLAVLVWWARRHSARPDAGPPCPWRWADAGFVLAFAVIYAATDEWHQGFVSTRTGSWVDVLWDSLGALLGLLCVWAWLQTRLRKEPA